MRGVRTLGTYGALMVPAAKLFQSKLPNQGCSLTSKAPPFNTPSRWAGLRTRILLTRSFISCMHTARHTLTPAKLVFVARARCFIITVLPGSLFPSLPIASDFLPDTMMRAVALGGDGTHLCGGPQQSYICIILVIFSTVNSPRAWTSSMAQLAIVMFPVVS
jgi:hypothetical protein